MWPATPHDRSRRTRAASSSNEGISDELFGTRTMMGDNDLNAERKERVAEFERRYGLHFRNPSLLFEALVHRSHANEVLGEKVQDNERLEYLGDAILEFVVTEYLYHKYPDASEGRLTMMRSLLVDRRNCARIGREAGFETFLFVGKGEKSPGRNVQMSILANAYEAVVGAVFLDQGMEAARQFVLKMIGRYAKDQEQDLSRNSKAELQIYAQKTFQRVPRYHVVSATGPDHQKRFEVTVHIGDEEMGRGVGPNKKAAQQKAARHALERIRQGQAPHLST